MKNIIFLCLSIILLNSCSNNEEQLNDTTNSKSAFQNSPNEVYHLEHIKENRLLEVKLTKSKTTYSNDFKYINTTDSTVLFMLTYTFDNSKIGWKWSEQQNALAFAQKLSDTQIDEAELNKLNFILDDGIPSIITDIKENNKDELLYSTIGYLKAATVSNIRKMNSESKEIQGTVSPFFLAGNDWFSFQEDIEVDLNIFRDNPATFQINPNDTVMQADIDLMNYIESTTDTIVTFDRIYKYFYPIEDFQNYVNEMATIPNHAGDCSVDCSVGCGTDLGCCGNYTGCCLMSSRLCLWHDKACVTCDSGHWWIPCGPHCVPDTKPNREVAYFTIK